MTRYTLANFRQRWPAEAMGICQADPQVANYCNRAIDRLLMDPMAPENGWYGSWMRMAFTVSVSSGSAYLTAPREVARITDIAACNQPLHIRNGFYEFLAYSEGLKPKTCSPTCTTVFEAYERDNVSTLGTMLSTAQTIRIYPSDTRDVGLRVLIQGKDANSQTVLTTDPGTGLSAPGEYVVIASPFADTINTWTEINGLQKDETYGNVSFYQVDPTTLVETYLSVMQPSEQTGWYRRYLLNSVPSTTQCCSTSPTMQITGQVRLDFIPVENETDYLLIPNLEALYEECRSIRFDGMDSAGAASQSAICHQRALSLLNGQLDMVGGKWNAAVKIPIWGSNVLTRQPV